MATATVPKTALPQATGGYDRAFYSGMAIVMTLTIFIGFAPTYYLRAVSGQPVTISGSAVTPLIHLHAALFTAWMALFIVQTTLIARRRVALHRTLGILGAVLAAAMVIAGVTTAIKSAAAGSAPPGISPQSFLAIPLGDMLCFASFVTAAVWLRNNKEAHKRLMLLAYISIAVAGVARLPGVLVRGPLAFYGLTFIFLLAGIAYDWASRRRIHPAYMWGGGALVASVPLRLMLSGTAPWRSFADFLIASLA